jgi:hypothetical protein
MGPQIENGLVVRLRAVLLAGVDVPDMHDKADVRIRVY